MGPTVKSPYPKGPSRSDPMALLHAAVRALQDQYHRFGHYPGLRPEERPQIKLIHLFLWGTLLFSVMVGTAGLLFGRPALAWLCWVGVAIQSFELWLIRQRHYRAVKHAFAGLFPAFLVAQTWLTGGFWQVAMLSLPLVTLTMFLFRSAWTRWYYVALYMAAMCLSLVVYAFGEAPFPLQQAPLVHACSVLVAMGMEVLFLNLYIDEVRLARRNVSRSERKYRTLFDRAPFPLVLYEGGVITACNEATLEVLGAHDRNQVIGFKPSAFSPDTQPDGSPSREKGQALEARIRRKGVSRFEWMHKRFDGEEVPVEVTVASVDAGMEFGMWQDLRERKAQEARIRDLLEQSRNQNRELERSLEAAQAVSRFAQALFKQRTEEDVLWELARKCVKRLGFREAAIYMVDEGAQRLYARAAHGPNNPINLAIRKPRPVAFGEGICGSVAQSGSAEIVPDTAADPRYLDDGRLGRSEIAVPISADDRVLGVIDSEHPEPGFFDQSHLHVLTMVASLVAHRIMHLREQNERIRDLQGQRSFYEDILNGIPADIAVLDNQHRYLFLNPQAVRSAEMRRWLIGKTDFDYIKERALPTAFAQRRKAVFDRVMQTGHSLHWEDRYERDGKEEVILRRLSPVLRDGEVRFVVGYGTDITRIKEAEAVIQDHNKLLRAEVAERTRELADAIDELKRSNAELESYASAASHDLQEPIRVIRQFLELLERTQADRLDPTGQECIHLAMEGAGRMQDMVRALLQYSRIGRDGIQTSACDVEAIVKGRVADLGHLIQDKNAVVRWRHLPRDVEAESALLGMVFYNLIGNALKFNDREQPVVDIWAEQRPDAWIFHIRDNGIGIPPEKEGYIFMPFKRLHDNERYAGTGIGLASCRKIVEHHGGCIGYHSTLGEGTDFWFALPLDPALGFASGEPQVRPCDAAQRASCSIKACSSGATPVPSGGNVQQVDRPNGTRGKRRTVPAPSPRLVRAGSGRLRRRPESPGD